MGKFLIVVIFLATSFYAQAQDYSFPIRKTKAQIQLFYKNKPFVISAQGDTIDSFSNSGNQLIYYYKDSICYRVKEIFPLDDEFVMQVTFDKFYKKIKDNTWVDPNNNQIDLTEDKEKKQFSFEVHSINSH